MDIFPVSYLMFTFGWKPIMLVREEYFIKFQNTKSWVEKAMPSQFFGQICGVWKLDQTLLRLSIYTQTLKFKIQPTVLLLLPSITIVNLLENNGVWLNGVKRSCSCAVIGGFRSTLSVSYFLWSVRCLHDYDWRQQNMQIVRWGWSLESVCYWKALLKRRWYCYWNNLEQKFTKFYEN